MKKWTLIDVHSVKMIDRTDQRRKPGRPFKGKRRTREERTHKNLERDREIKRRIYRDQNELMRERVVILQRKCAH